MLVVAVVVAETVDHGIERNVGHALKAERANQNTGFGSHVASGNPKFFALIVKLAGGGLVDSFHRFYSPFLLCL